MCSMFVKVELSKLNKHFKMARAIISKIKCSKTMKACHQIIYSVLLAAFTNGACIFKHTICKLHEFTRLTNSTIACTNISYLDLWSVCKTRIVHMFIFSVTKKDFYLLRLN